MLQVRMSGIGKRFGDVRALDAVDFELAPGEVHALLGENGAGKSTLMHVLAGEVLPDEGEVRLAGQPVSLRSPSDAAARGIAIVHQHFTLVENFTVAENLALVPQRGVLRRDGARRPAGESLAVAGQLGWQFDARARVWQLPVGVRQRLEITKALARRPNTLILDEPTAVLTPAEAEELFRVVRRLADGGTSLVFITHKLSEVAAIADRITILRHGRHVATLARAEATADRLARLMIGDDAPAPATTDEGRGRTCSPPNTRHPTPNTSAAPVLLEVRRVRALDDRGALVVDGVDLTVREGEILGIAGVDGNGQHELAEAMAGLRPRAAGELRVLGEPPRLSPRWIGYIPQDRLRAGIVAGLTVAENLSLGLQADPEFRAGPWLRRRRIGAAVTAMIDRYDIRVVSPRQLAGTLSGGNQQKLVVARVLYLNPKLVVAVNPARGLDVGSTAFVHRQLREQRARGAVVLFSTDLDEITQLSDRVAVLSRGRIVGEVPPDTSRATLGLMMGGEAVASRLESVPESR